MLAETLNSYPDVKAENILDLIFFNTSTIASQHLKETRDIHTTNINYLHTEIKTTEAQLDSTLFQNPMTKAQSNYHIKLQIKLIDIVEQLKSEHL